MLTYLQGSTPVSTCTFNPVNVWLLQEANKHGWTRRQHSQREAWHYQLDCTIKMLRKFVIKICGRCHKKNSVVSSTFILYVWNIAKVFQDICFIPLHMQCPCIKFVYP